MIVAVERMDVVAVVRLLRSHPLTRHLSQMTLAQLTGMSQASISGWESGTRVPDPRRAVEVLEGLGTPGRRWGMRWLLPADLTDDTEPEPPPSTSAVNAPRVVITAPGPITVQVMKQPPAADQRSAIAFVADQDGPRLMVAEDSTWGVRSSPKGTTAWFTLVAPGQPALTTHEPKDPR
ncbi:helix-turn-helix transcriptional regulator [Nocardiopsis dassonvillei]